MIVKLGKATEETKDQYWVVTLYDGSPFPPLIYWRAGSN